ncbi:hypothetical protein DPM19_32730 [Actinomadura craniellae]|uniref:YdbS-like PH domain-containing protein n=1 Tax=Actinomadura craniellae TaxID=2231787 RepID=A0A365GVQ5_9ACTN|nr:PH domain-containing protein [Actinomadura craniellae]RAY10907.1 hypothetical protein DPM19_32730 [Actinomadura craniellae]
MTGRAIRLHPLTILVGAIRELIALLVAGAAGLAVGGLSTAFYFTLLGLGFGLVLHLVKWATFTYTVHDNRIELRRALIGRSVKIIPRERVRGVDISSTLPHRLLGLAVVHVDAGSDGGDGTLNAVSRQEADRLRRVLLSHVAEMRRTPADDTELARASPRWNLYAPLGGTYLLTPFAVAGSVLGTLYNLGDEFGFIDERRLSHLGRDVLGLPVTVGVVVALLFLVAMPIGSVIAFALFNWDFSLRARGEELIAERGLLTRRTVSLERRRIRGVELIDNPLERLAGAARLGALVTGLGDAAQRGRLLPTAPVTISRDVAARVVGTVPGPLVTHPPAALRRRVVRAIIPPLAFTVIALLAGRPWAACAGLVLMILAVPLGADRYHQLGHALDRDRLTVRSGALRRRQAVVERRAVVGWRLRQTLFQRRLGLATLVVAVGAGEGGYPAIDMAEQDAVAFAEEVTPAWVRPFLNS